MGSNMQQDSKKAHKRELNKLCLLNPNPYYELLTI